MPEPRVPTESDACVFNACVGWFVCVCVCAVWRLASRLVQLVLCQQRALEKYAADVRTILGKSGSKVLQWENTG